MNAIKNPDPVETKQTNSRHAPGILVWKGVDSAQFLKLDKPSHWKQIRTKQIITDAVIEKKIKKEKLLQQ